MSIIEDVWKKSFRNNNTQEMKVKRGRERIKPQMTHYQSQGRMMGYLLET